MKYANTGITVSRTSASAVSNFEAATAQHTLEGEIGTSSAQFEVWRRERNGTRLRLLRRLSYLERENRKLRKKVQDYRELIDGIPFRAKS